ncbi:SPFH domain-containing protein [uncultured Flavobacterium sp.]|uniref:SPFH domain-containing protein n=1 Tax=uncultured Flavobacterium sp. TaxID=165435 RepID=UPI0030EB84D4|tara:strand:+ start:29852 stop:30394 length:543 start_codon:yes stop_codon:yes gene_type:complete
MNQVKDFIEYIINAIKIWVIIQPWESGLRVRAGKNIKQLASGLHFKIPYIDSIYVQENRLRIIEMSMQTLTTKDNKTITIEGAIGYKISNLKELYDTLYQPELALMGLTKSLIVSNISESYLEKIEIKNIEDSILLELKKLGYGIDFEYFKILNFCHVRTYRLLQDQSWAANKLDVNKKK